MRTIVIYCIDYMGHILECLGVAEKARKCGIKVVFAFVLYPRVQIYEILQRKGYDVYVAKEYLAVAFKSNDKKSLIKAYIDSVKSAINWWNPEMIICDGMPLIPVVCHKQGVKCACVTRTNIPLLFSISNYETFQKSLCDLGMINKQQTRQLQKIIDGDIQLVPHSEFFMKIDKSNPYYYCPAEICLNSVMDASQYDIICVLSTACDMEYYKQYMIDVLRRTEYRVLLCYPQAKEPCTIGNIHVRKWIDLAYVIERAKLVISTGGHGTITKAIISGKPQIVLEIKELYSIQYGECIERHKLGKYINIRALQKQDVLNIITELCEGFVYQYCVDYMSDDFKRSGEFDYEEVFAWCSNI